MCSCAQTGAVQECQHVYLVLRMSSSPGQNLDLARNIHSLATSLDTKEGTRKMLANAQPQLTASDLLDPD